MNPPNSSIRDMQAQVAEFVADRHWQRYHTPKNLAMALAVEAAELMEHFQWLSPEESVVVREDEARKEAVGEEICDVLAYALSLAEALRLDLAAAFEKKMRKNAIKYPAPPRQDA